MLYAWEDSENVDKHKSPKIFLEPKKSFTALVAARHEEKVIADTIISLNNINYPKDLKEVIILCRNDDLETIEKVKETINLIGNENIKLHIFEGDLINKPHALNVGLNISKNEIVTVFDAEDEPHRDIYNVVNTIMLMEKVDVVQSGVQLMNYKSNWFSSLNCLEYYFWFKSGLHFFSNFGKVTPLGGNTVFFKKDQLQEIGGWNENCLTEDAEIGFRLVSKGSVVRIVYDEAHVTKEETPDNFMALIRQRTRWNQGFIQILFSGICNSLPLFRQKLVGLFILLSPLFQAITLIYLPFALWIAFTNEMPLFVSLFSFVPLLVFILQIVIFSVGIHEFTKSYNFKFYWHMPVKVLLTFVPYQMLLSFSAIRATYRFVINRNTWEKTMHSNAHRTL